jgi:tetratricopeptide (TPR) repeat protein/pimeloyl-ACP methyl ester carboxylesterase
MARLEHVHHGDPALPVIVFVHGLSGDLFDTWVGPGASRDNCWLQWIGQDTSCDTWTLQYDAELSRWKGQAMPLPDQGTQVAHLLAVHAGLTNRSIVLVAHSMGGLVIKTMITQTLASGDEQTRGLLDQICGIAFVATPHQGSQLASLAKAASAILRTNAQVGNMSLHDAHLRQLGAAFREQRRKLNFKVIAFAEGREVEWQQKGWFGLFTKQVGVRVVDPSSSDPGLEGVTPVPLAEDHFSICKPSNRDAQIHRALVAFVRNGVLAHLPRAAALDGAVVQTTVPPLVPVTLPTRQPFGRVTESDSRLLPAEGRFYGRQDEVAQVLAFLRGQGNGVVVTAREVSGVGGIGKTEVCKAALKLWLSEQPDQIAWFVPVADGANLAGLVDRLVSAVNLPEVQTAEQLLQVLPPGLYYLDNLESVASLEEGVAFLRAMQQLSGVRLLVSSRYSLPSVFGASIEIGVLPRDAALRLFRELWLGHDPLPTDDLIAEFVVGDLGCHALSVTLAARLGDCYAYCDLVQRWRAVGAALLQQPSGTGRQGSLPASLRLTAEALSRTPGALGLWTVFALFATGVSDALMEELERRSGWAAARPALVRHHVIKRQADDRWTMLPPLARYALGASLTQTDGFGWAAARSSVRAMFCDQAREADSVQSTASSLAARAWLLGNFESLARLLRHEMQASPPDAGWLQDLHHRLINQYQFKPMLAVDLLPQLIEALARPGSALKLLGDIEFRLGHLDEARALYNRALAEFEREQAKLGRANALRSLGDLERRLGRLDEARALYNKALAQYENEEAGLGQANTLKALGDLESRLGLVDEAKALYNRALVQFEREQDELGGANTLRALGDLEMRLGQVDEAKALYDRALAQYEREHAELGQANTLKSLGNLAGQLGRLDEARALYDRALSLYERQEAGLGRANTLRELGMLESQLGRLDEATTLYNSALAQFELEQDALGQANTLQALGDLVRLGGDPTGAATIYQRAIGLYALQKEHVGLALTSAELARCFHALGREGDRDLSLLDALDFANRTGKKHVVQYAWGCLTEMMGGHDGAQAWLLRHKRPDQPLTA